MSKTYQRKKESIAKYNKTPKGKLAKHKARITHARKIRFQLIEFLGGPICVHCGFSDIRAIQIDHINGDGSEQLKEFGSNREIMMTYYLKHLDQAKEDLQILCANCNWIKRDENDECKRIEIGVVDDETLKNIIKSSKTFISDSTQKF